VLHGGPGADLLLGNTGNDQVFGQRGNDVLYGGWGDDELFGQRGNDSVSGRRGQDQVFGGPGSDALFGGLHADLVNGGRGPDTMRGGRGPDVLRGSLGDDLARGGYGHDAVYGGTGDDQLWGGRGNDTLRAIDGESFQDVLSCGSGLFDSAFADQPDVVLPDCESNSQNVAPEAVADTFSTTEDTTLDLPVAGAGSPASNDNDADGDPLTVDSVSGAIGGTVSISAGAIHFVPDPDLCGPAAGSFDYTVSDGEGGTDSGQVTVDITCVPDDPTAADDSATVAEDAAASAIPVLANDDDPDGDPLEITSVTQPANGTVAITGGGSGLTYEPDTNYCNTFPPLPDTFTYTLTPGGSTATVSVTVTCVDDAPVAVDDTATVSEDASATAVPVLANDGDVDGGTMQVASTTQPDNGSVVITGGGTGLTYLPDANYCNAPPGTSPDTFTYTLNGGSTATVSVTVTCADDAPVAVNDSTTVAEDSAPTAVAVLANDTDVDGGPMSIGSVTQPANGAVVITGGGTGLTYTANANFCSATADTFTYTLNGGSTATVSVTVTCVNDAPVAVDDSATVAEDASATAVGVLANDTDVDGGTKTVEAVTQPANGTAVITGGGTGLTYVPDANYCNSPPGTTLDTFTYTLNGGSTATVSVTVTCVDDLPVAVDDSATVTLNDSATAIDVLANDGDVDGGSMTVQSSSQPANGTVVITGGGTGLTYAPDAAYCNTPGGAADTFTYTLNGGSTATVSVTVTCDVPPVAVNDSSTVTEDSGPSAVSVLANDTDVDSGPISIASTTQPANGTVVVTGGGTGLTYGPDANYCNDPPGTTLDTFTYTLAPGGSTATVSMTVTCVDDAPVAVNDAATVLEDASAAAVTVLANDTDLDGGPTSIESVSQPANGAVVITGGGTGLTYAPNPNYCNQPPGTTLDTFTYTLNGSSTATVSMTVTCVNDAPVADDETFSAADSAVGNTALVVDDPTDGAPSLTAPKKSISGDILSGDADVDGPGPLVVTAGTFATNDGGSVLIESDGDFTFTPAAGTSCSDASDFFDYTVSDQNPVTPATDTGRVTIAIAGCVWYVHNSATGNSGTSTAPFDTLAQAESASAAGDTIYLFDGDNTTTGYAAGIDLKANQRLIGEVAALQVGSDLLYVGNAANRPTLTDNNADVVALAAGNVVRGVEINPQGTGGGIAGGAGDAGGTIDDVRIIDTGTAGTQPSLELDATSGTFNVSSLTVDSSAATGTTSGSIGVRLNSAGTVNFASAGTISITSAGAKGLDATGTAMGAGSVFDDITVTGSGSGGVSMVSTTGTSTFGDGTGVDLALTTTSGTAAGFLLSSAGSVSVPGAGTANISATGGPAVDVSGTSGATLDLDTVSSANSSTDGVNLDGLGSGSFSAASASTLGGYAGIGFDLNGGSGAITFPGTFNNGAGNTAEVTGRSGGAVTFSGAVNDTVDANGGIVVGGAAGLANTGGSTVFSGSTKTLSTGAGDAVVFTNSDGHTLTLSGGGLDVDTTTGKGIEATTAGTLNITGADNTIDTGAGKALNVSDTDVGASPLAFVRISSDGANGGIRLSNTGANSALTVASSGSGTCTAADQTGCTGGTVQNSTGADDGGALPTGAGILLNNTRGVSLTRMLVQDHANYGIRGTSVVGFTMADSVINGVNGTSALTAHKDGSVRFEELSGTVTMTNVPISGGYYTNLMVDNTSGVLNGTFDNVDSGTIDATGGDDAIQFEGIGTSTMNVDFKNSAVTTASGDLFQYIGDGTGGGNLDLTGNAFTNNEPSIATGGGGIALVAGAKGAATMDVLNNTMKDSLTNALTIIKSRDNTAGTNNLVANVTNNTIGLAGTANSGSAEGDGMEITTFGDGNATFNVTNNNVRQYNSSAFQFVAGSGVADAGQFNINFSGNSAGNPGTNPSITLLQGVRVDSGVDINDTFATCVKFGANTITGSSDAANKDFRLVASQNTTIRQPGYGGGATDGAAFAAFAAAAIGSGAQGTAVANAPATFLGTGSSCP
jgi:VCBS repeat-containing protein